MSGPQIRVVTRGDWRHLWGTESCLLAPFILDFCYQSAQCLLLECVTGRGAGGECQVLRLVVAMGPLSCHTPPQREAVQHCKYFTELVHIPECSKVFPRWLNLSGLLSFICSVELIVNPEPAAAVQTPPKGFSHPQLWPLVLTSFLIVFPITKEMVLHMSLIMLRKIINTVS